jgi:hypothetical protein
VISQLRKTISDHVKGVESARKREYNEYVEAEALRKRQEMEADFQANLERVGREKAEEIRKLEEELDEITRRQQEEETRHSLEIEQVKAALAEQRKREEENRNNKTDKPIDTDKQKERKTSATNKIRQINDINKARNLLEKICESANETIIEIINNYDV